MNLKQALKITLLIVILAEEIKSVKKTKTHSIKIGFKNGKTFINENGITEF